MTFIYIRFKAVDFHIQLSKNVKAIPVFSLKINYVQLQFALTLIADLCSRENELFLYDSSRQKPTKSFTLLIQRSFGANGANRVL